MLDKTLQEGAASGDPAARIGELARVRIAVLGDVMVDRFIWGRVARISPEAPVPVVEVDRSRENDGFRLGGAANVAHNLVQLGARSALFGVVGDDDTGQHFWRMMASQGIDGRGIQVVPGRPTTLKTRVVAHAQQVVRFDVEDRSPLPEGHIAALYERLLQYADQFDAVIISDYAKGVIHPGLLPDLIEALRAKGRIVAVDPKVQNMLAYRKASVITPNRLEACTAAGVGLDTPDAARQAGEILLRRLECDAVLVTLGEDGMLLMRREDPELHVAARAAEVFDVTGAGDTVVAVLSLALAAGRDWRDAIQLANAAAGIVVGKIGTATVGAEELSRAIRAHPPRS